MEGKWRKLSKLSQKNQVSRRNGSSKIESQVKKRSKLIEKERRVDKVKESANQLENFQILNMDAKENKKKQ